MGSSWLPHGVFSIQSLTWGCCCEIRELRLAKLGIHALDGFWLLALSKIPVESKFTAGRLQADNFVICRLATMDLGAWKTMELSKRLGHLNKEEGLDQLAKLKFLGL